MLWCYVGQSSFIDTTESFHGEAHLWVPIALLWSSFHHLIIEIPSIIRGWELPSLATAATECLHTHKILCDTTTLDTCPLSHATHYNIFIKVLHTSWGKWLDIGEHPLYPQGNWKFGRNQLHCWILTLGMPSHLNVQLSLTTSSLNWHHNHPHQ